MKKVIYISGVILLNVFAFGSIFKILHWPGANILFTLSLGLFSCMFLPLAVLSKFRNNGNKSIMLYLSGFLCAFVCIVSALFKVMHWPGASVMLLISIPLPFVFFLPVYIYHHNKSKEKSYMNFIGIMLLMVFIAVFNAMLALGINKEVLMAMIAVEKSQSESLEVIKSKNAVSYHDILAYSEQNEIILIDSVRKLSGDVSARIDQIKVDLVSMVIGNIKKSETFPVQKITESGVTSLYMRGEDETGGKAEELKVMIRNYSILIKRFVKEDTAAVNGINSLLDTSDKLVSSEGYNQITSWEDSYFRSGTYFILILSNLECIEVSVKVAESIALNSIIRN